MDLTSREGYGIKFCIKLIAVISHDNYYSFIALLVNWYNNGLLPLIRHYFILASLIAIQIKYPKTRYVSLYFGSYFGHKMV
jgi:hypothetical protein